MAEPDLKLVDDVGKTRGYFLTFLAIITLLGTVGFIVGFILHNNNEGRQNQTLCAKVPVINA